MLRPCRLRKSADMLETPTSSAPAPTILVISGAVCFAGGLFSLNTGLPRLQEWPSMSNRSDTTNFRPLRAWGAAGGSGCGGGGRLRGSKMMAAVFHRRFAPRRAAALLIARTTRGTTAAATAPAAMTICFTDGAPLQEDLGGAREKAVVSKEGAVLIPSVLPSAPPPPPSPPSTSVTSTATASRVSSKLRDMGPDGDVSR
mmetsp:Transcript_31934/g.90696  ORF Transcript_31934/g.90696 Transcript_31934/m.90696 type:complete len:200 (+) Transcript_31934:1540-2139(+)